jgi:hypothetical protein
MKESILQCRVIHNYFQKTSNRVYECRCKAVPWLRRLVTLLKWMPGFASGSVHVWFVVDKVDLGWDFTPEFFGSPLSISFHRSSPYSYLGINIRSFGGPCSETTSYRIDVNVNVTANITPHSTILLCSRTCLRTTEAMYEQSFIIYCDHNGDVNLRRFNPIYLF